MFEGIFFQILNVQGPITSMPNNFSKWRIQLRVQFNSYKLFTVEYQASQLDVVVPTVSPAHNNIYKFEKLCR